jgi:hypothetical protein
MANSIITATVALVPVGHLTIEGLMDEEGKYYVAVTQFNQLISFSASNNTISRDLKRLLGESFSPSKAKTNLYKQLINVFSIEQFELALTKLDRLGNQKAQEFRDQLVGLSLHQLFSDAFSVKFEKEERQGWIKKRQENIDSFWLIGEATELYKSRHSELSQNTLKFMYPNYQDAINRGLFGKTAKQIREILGLSDKNKLNRDHYGKKALVNIESIQRLAAQLINQDKLPLDAVKQALSLYSYPVIDFLD